MDNNESEDLPKEQELKLPFKHVQSKVGRNDKCPCGSAKKFKKCCLNSPITTKQKIVQLIS